MNAADTRVDRARKAFLTGDRGLAQKAHKKGIIRKTVGHGEEHKKTFTLPEIILGGQDGLVNVLGVILGVAAATADVKIVIVAGLAATFAESVSMAAVAYTSKIAEADYYQSEYEREKWEVEHFPEGEREEIRALYARYGFAGAELEDIVQKITSNKSIWLEVMMSQELKLEPVDRTQAVPAAVIVGVSALIGSFIPLVAFFFLPIKASIYLSLIVSSLTLFLVGSYKAKVTIGRNVLRQGIEMMVIGMVSAFVGYAIGSIFKVPAS
ncbi:MAG TPA: VIT1/CCC1 transporter family protein [Patescibacteria group bacterium]|nr:VIT1/CCC1 transporter family protein [Patescibacteria group bacterium]